MQSLYDLGMKIQKIREAIDNITTKGSENAAYILYAHNQCNEVISGINALIKQTPSSEIQNGNEITEQETVNGEEGEIENAG